MKTQRTASAITDHQDPGPDRILGGLYYLQKCLQNRRPFAVITGAVGSGRRVLLERFLSNFQGARIARHSAPTHDEHAFLESILKQFGFDPFESSVEDLRRLVTVFIQHESIKGNLTVIAVDDAQDYGPRVLETIQGLATTDHEGTPDALFVLTGTEALHRVLDSAGMLAVSAMTRERYSLDAAPDAHTSTNGGGVAEQPETEAGPAGELIVSLDGNMICRCPLDREQMLIGRNEHNDVPIVSRYVSRHHALLVNTADGGAYVVDLKSTNGTYVNSVAIHQHALKDGDVISIGNFRLKYANATVPRATSLGKVSPASFAKTLVMRSARGIGRKRLKPIKAAETEPAEADSAGGG
jgi:hypothetical protein